MKNNNKKQSFEDFIYQVALAELNDEKKLAENFVIRCFNQETNKYVLVHRSSKLTFEKDVKEIEHIEEFKKDIERYDPLPSLERRAERQRLLGEYLDWLENRGKGGKGGKSDGGYNPTNTPKAF